MTQDVQTLYQVLDIEADASSEQIHDAYYRQVRNHPPEKDSEGFQRVTRAYEVLSQPASRKEYDETSRTDHETQNLLDEGRALLEKGEIDSLGPLKRALMRHPESPMIRDLVVQALILSELLHDAEKHARRVLGSEPENPSYNLRLGEVLSAQERHSDAASHYAKAMMLDDETPNITVSYAWSLVRNKQQTQAVALLEEAILRDGQVDFDDFQYFQALCRMHTNAEDWPALESVHSRIRDVIPGDKETRAFVAWFYYMDAMGMANAGNFDGALRAIDEAANIDDALPELRSTRASIKESKKALDEAVLLRDDESLNGPLRYAVSLIAILRSLGGNDQIRDMLNQAIEAVQHEVQVEGAGTRTTILTIRNRYPNASALAEEFLDNVGDVSAQGAKRFRKIKCPGCSRSIIIPKPTIEALQHAGISKARAIEMLLTSETMILKEMKLKCEQCGTPFDGTGAKPESSGCFVVTAACGDETAFPVVVLREYRDECIARCRLGHLAIAVYRLVGPWFAAIVRANSTIRKLAYHLVWRLAVQVNRRHLLWSDEKTPRIYDRK